MSENSANSIANDWCLMLNGFKRDPGVGEWDEKTWEKSIRKLFSNSLPFASPRLAHIIIRRRKSKNIFFCFAAENFSTFNSWVNLHILKPRREMARIEGGEAHGGSNLRKRKTIIFRFTFSFASSGLLNNPFKVAKNIFMWKLFWTFSSTHVLLIEQSATSENFRQFVFAVELFSIQFAHWE